MTAKKEAAARRGQTEATELTEEQAAEETSASTTAYVGTETVYGYFLDEDQRLGGNGEPTLNEVEVDNDLLAEYRDLKAEWESMQDRLQGLYASSTPPEGEEEETPEATELTEEQKSEETAAAES